MGLGMRGGGGRGERETVEMEEPPPAYVAAVAQPDLSHAHELPELGTGIVTERVDEDATIPYSRLEPGFGAMPTELGKR